MSELNSLETQNDERPDVVDQETNHSDFAMVEEDGGQADAVDQQEVEATEEAEGKATHKQTKEENHAAKAARVKAEREAKAQIEQAKREALAELESKLRTSGVKNPYTEKGFESFDELFDYGKKITEAEQRERAEDEGKTLEEIQQEDADKAYIARKRQEDSEAEEQERQKTVDQERISKDLKDFQERYPDTDVSNVVMNESFKKFAGSRLGTEPLADLYTDFVELVGEAEANGRAKDTRGLRSTGSGSEAGNVLTAAQKRSLEQWNRENPDMKMTPKEYLSRIK